MTGELRHIVEAKALAGYRLWIRFDDRTEGVVDLSDLVGKGVFAAWRDEASFRRVSVDPDTRTVTWPGGIDLCPDSLYCDISAVGRKARTRRPLASRPCRGGIRSGIARSSPTDRRGRRRPG